MNDLCQAYEDALLSEDAGRQAELSAHAAGCAACQDKRALWQRIERVAPTLRKSWESPDLLARIQETAARPARPVPFVSVWGKRLALAAVLALFAVATLIGVRTPVPAEPGFGLPEIPRETLLSDDSLEKVEKTEAAYRTSIDELEQRARPRLENATSPLLANTREKLLVLDAAIAECRREIERNQLNTHLRRELLAMYVEKTKTLQGLFPESNGDKS